MDRSRIFAHIKESLQGDGPTDMVLSGGNALIARDFVGRLLEVLVHDAGDHFEILQERHLAKLGLTEDEAFALGERNLEGLVDAGTVMVYRHGDGFAIVAGGNHEAFADARPEPLLEARGPSGHAFPPRRRAGSRSAHGRLGGERRGCS